MDGLSPDSGGLKGGARSRADALAQALDRLADAHRALADAHATADAARALLRDAIDSLADGFALFDAEDRMVLCNRAFLKMFPWFEAMRDSAPAFAEMARRMAEAGATIGSRIAPDRWLRDRMAQHREARGAHVQALADGRWIQINELRTSGGGIVGIYTDVTMVKAEDARQRARELGERNLALQTTLDTLSEGVCLFDVQRRLQAWNEGVAALLGLDVGSEGALLASHEALVRWCAEQGGLERAEALEWREGGGARVVSDCRMFADGEGARHFTIRSVPLTSGGMVFTFDDVTDQVRFRRSLTETAETLERRVAERTAELVEVNLRLVAATEAALEANRSKTSFLAAASHDLLQPLNAARLFVSALGSEALPEKPQALVRQAASALDSVEDLLEALFEISRLDAGAIQPELGDLPLAPLLAALRREFAPLAEAAGLALVVPDSADWVRSDARLLRRVLQNFVSNAIRYTAQGEVRVELAAAGAGAAEGAGEGAGDELVVTVRDTGPGIAEAERAAIYEEFRRLDATRKIPGKGLGLAIVRRVTTMLGHELGLESTPGKGSAFSVRLPRAVPRPACTAPEELGDPAGPGTRCGGGALVLVIDNEPAILAGMAALLGSWGLEVVAAGDPDDPQVAAALARGPAMLIADYHLDNGLTGDDAVLALRARLGRDLPACLVTADRGEPLKARAAALGLPLFTKPVKPARLRALLRQLEVL
ncbi:PAS domain-containing sensor histidine kinase [Novosphingobium sp. KA1]|uniref:hybrid sensor histidine kinase/response regulator n=1 Tax=Novosphingobium sp. (strain KA1) TaxID=164608 RepID=UPI001A8F72F0|nr:PAS domain-containing sensor histidine kinase [Novosphingobium sp. KA1]QSR17642.1 hybrid sensor histidine kinase/response regulator [Novosphingobium sp. KA1]